MADRGGAKAVGENRSRPIELVANDAEPRVGRLVAAASLVGDGAEPLFPTGGLEESGTALRLRQGQAANPDFLVIEEPARVTHPRALNVERRSEIIGCEVRRFAPPRHQRSVQQVRGAEARRDEARRSIPAKDARVRQSVGLNVDHTRAMECLELRPGHKGRRRSVGILGVGRVLVDRRSGRDRLRDPARNRERDATKTVLSQKGFRHRPQTGACIVEAERDAEASRVLAVADQAADRIRGDGLVGILGQVLQLRLQAGRADLMEVKYGEQTPDGPPKKETRIAAGSQVEQAP